MAPVKQAMPLARLSVADRTPNAIAITSRLPAMLRPRAHIFSTFVFI